MFDYSAALIAFTGGALAGLALVLTRSLHGRLSLDRTGGVQKLHKEPTPRVGGVALAVGLLAGGLSIAAPGLALGEQVLIAAVPAFLAGLLEDLTKSVSVRLRLAATCLSGLLFVLLSGYRIGSVDIASLDWLLGVWLISVLFTAFAIGGIANAINLIDGVNGLAAGAAIIIFSGFAVIAGLVQDLPLLAICLTVIGALAGFLLLNFPMAYLFLGDAGAYAVGYLLAVVAVMLPARNPELSPLLGLLALSYPVIETLVSIHRRLSRKGAHPGQPDRLHLHSLVFRDLSRRLAGALGAPELRNPLAGMIMWIFPLVSVGLTILFRESSGLLLLGVGAMAVFYLRAYRRVALLGAATASPMLRRNREA